MKRTIEQVRRIDRERLVEKPCDRVVCVEQCFGFTEKICSRAGVSLRVFLS